MQQEHVSHVNKESQSEESSIDWEQVTLFKLGESLRECESLDRIDTPMKRIFLLNTQVVTETIEQICENSNWKGLQILQIYGGKLNEMSIKQLVLNGEWEELEELRLVECDLNDECLDLLTNHSKWSKLKVLDVSRNKITRNGLENCLKEMKLPLECLFVDENFQSDESDKSISIPSTLKLLYTKQGDATLQVDQVYSHILLKRTFLESKKQSNAKSMLNLANLLRNDFVLPFEVRDISRLTIESAIHGCVEANYFAGMLFYKENYVGDEFIPNPLKTKFLHASNLTARIWFEKGAEKENPGCLYRLGEFYEYGKSVDQSDDLAFEWYKKAADLDYPDALMRVAEFYFLGISTPINEAKGVEYTKKAAENGNLKALELLAGFYEKGKLSESGQELIERSLDLADETYSRYLDLKSNDSDILFKVGCLHMFEEEWEHANIKYAISCLQQSSHLSNCRASFTLGNFFLNNENAEMAYYYFLESSKQGHPRAHEALSIFQVTDSRNPDQ